MRPAAVQCMAATLLCGILLSGVARADVPEALASATTVSAEDVVAAQTAGAAVIDTRVASEYAEGHIKGAVSVPYREKSAKAVDFDASQDAFNLAKLPADKTLTVVFYCNGPDCWKSFTASTAAIKAGYTRIDWYRGGFPDWKSKGLPVE